MDAGRLRARHGMAPQPAVKSRRNIRPKASRKPIMIVPPACAPSPTVACGSSQFSSPPLTSQRLKEDEDRAKNHGNAASYGTDAVRGSLRVGNQIEQREAHDQEDDEPLDPLHVGLVILPVFTEYSNALPRVQAEASMLPSLTRAGESPGEAFGALCSRPAGAALTWFTDSEWSSSS